MLFDQAYRAAQSQYANSSNFRVFENENFESSESNAAEASPETEETFLDKIDLFRNSTPIVDGAPAAINAFDSDDDAIVFAYDPTLNPDPQMGLMDGTEPGDKILTMNGNPVVYFSQSPGLRLADINMIEVEMAG